MHNARAKQLIDITTTGHAFFFVVAMSQYKSASQNHKPSELFEVVPVKLFSWYEVVVPFIHGLSQEEHAVKDGLVDVASQRSGALPGPAIRADGTRYWWSLSASQCRLATAI